MQRGPLLALLGLIAGTSQFASSYKTSFAVDKPVHTTIAILFLCGLSILIVARQRPSPKSSRLPQHDRDDELYKEARAAPDKPLAVVSWRHQLKRLFRPQAVVALLLILAICARAEIVRRVLKDIQCARHSFLGYLPITSALADVFLGSTLSVSESLRLPFQNTNPSRARYLLVFVLLGWSTTITFADTFQFKTTYICPTSDHTASVVARLQQIGSLLDHLVILISWYLLQPHGNHEQRRQRSLLTGLTLITSSFALFLAIIIVYMAMPEHRHWIVSLSSLFLRDAIKMAFLVAFIVGCFVITVQQLDMTAALLIVVSASQITSIFRNIWRGVFHSFLPAPISTQTSHAIFLMIALLLYVSGYPPSGSRGRTLSSVRNRIQAVLLVCLILIISLFVRFATHSQQLQIHDHPIHTLIKAAELRHDIWAKQAKSSESLDDAVRTYRTRYNRHPPPHFETWWAYAVERSSAVLDDFDTIEEDLEPFWSLPPPEIRKRTAEILADPSSEVGGISIRDGKLEISSNVPGTHRWMVQGAVDMIQKFAQWLPDMDLAMNLNDECRVAIPFGPHSQPAALQLDSSKAPGFSTNRSWPQLEPLSDSRFIRMNLQPTFEAFGSISCPPDSPARKERKWDTSSLCTACMAPHAVGPFVKNWSISSNPCHQPDLANLHGLHLSPSAFVGTHELMPIFSQSKAPGYADIRYPSPWNYMDKVVYNPTDEYPDTPFLEKENVLFWRGATTEGLSAGQGAWKGMLRQRVSNLLGNHRGLQLVLAPSGIDQFSYQIIKGEGIEAFINVTTDVRLVGPIARCGGADCLAQTEEFHFGEPVDFQQHWRYKYLFDADGAGFSGRFIPFLQSNSVVLKTALFRDWYEGRLEAWRHFIPIDLRLQDVWSVLLYLGGGGMESARAGPGLDAAERMARESRSWANKVLRKEDMEIYFFRLLLEWGRLTDDARDEIGFTI